MMSKIVYIKIFSKMSKIVCNNFFSKIMSNIVYIKTSVKWCLMLSTLTPVVQRPKYRTFDENFNFILRRDHQKNFL